MTQHDNILIVQVPKIFLSAKWETGNEGKVLWINPELGIKGKRIKLPHGDWRKIGRSNELTEEDWEDLIDRYVYPFDDEFFGEISFRDYTDKKQFNKGYYNLKTAKKSGMSLLRSHGIDPETNPLILKKEDNKNA